MIEITCDKCGRKVVLRTKSVTAKILEKYNMEAVSLDKDRIWHLCFDCVEEMIGEEG